MVHLVSRRVLLQAGVGMAALGTAGCVSFGSDVEYQPVVVRNHRDASHEVEVVFDRGESYSADRRSAALAPGGEERFDEFVPSSDWDYPYRLETHVDGEHVKTTPHRWERDAVILNLRTDGTVHVSNVEPNELVTLTTRTTTGSEASSTPENDSTTTPAGQPRTSATDQ